MAFSHMNIFDDRWEIDIFKKAIFKLNNNFLSNLRGFFLIDKIHLFHVLYTLNNFVVPIGYYAILR